MTNKDLKEKIALVVNDESELDQIAVLEGDEFADGCIGLTIDNRLVYSYERLIESLSKHSEISYEDAMEYIEFNTIRSLPYIAAQDLHAPIIIHEFDA